MTTTTKEVFEKYEIRKTKKQRQAFRDYVQSVASKYGYKSSTEKVSFGGKNIIVGDVDKAEVLYTAHYDTCAKMIFPNFITPNNIFIYLVYQIIILIGFSAVSIPCGLLLSSILIASGVESYIATDIGINFSFAVYLVLLFLLIAGPANKHTANDNTSGVTTLLDIMTALPQEKKDKVAFVFFDLEEVGLIGSFDFAAKHKDIKNNKLVINFDCVSDGETIFFALKKSTKNYKALLEKSFVSTKDVTVEIAEKGAFYPSDNANFKGGIGVAALKRSRFMNMLYMNRIHTKRDTVYRKENIEFLKNGAIRLLEIM